MGSRIAESERPVEGVQVYSLVSCTVKVTGCSGQEAEGVATILTEGGTADFTGAGGAEGCIEGALSKADSGQEQERATQKSPPLWKTGRQ